MIGNDVVDLVQSRRESNWTRPGFMSKLFTDSEQLLVADSKDSELAVWLLWSMKEAAYKIWHRHNRIRKFMPKQLVCSLIKLSSHYAWGKVTCGESIFYTVTMISADLIHSIAVDDLTTFSQVKEIEKAKILKDPDGIPYFLVPDRREPLAVSVSHHGRFEKVVALFAV